MNKVKSIDKDIIALYKKGYSDERISQILNIKIDYVKYRRQKLGLRKIEYYRCNRVDKSKDVVKKAIIKYNDPQLIEYINYNARYIRKKESKPEDCSYKDINPEDCWICFENGIEIFVKKENYNYGGYIILPKVAENGNSKRINEFINKNIKNFSSIKTTNYLNKNNIKFLINISVDEEKLWKSFIKQLLEFTNICGYRIVKKKYGYEIIGRDINIFKEKTTKYAVMDGRVDNLRDSIFLHQ